MYFVQIVPFYNDIFPTVLTVNFYLKCKLQKDKSPIMQRFLIYTRTMDEFLAGRDKKKEK